MMYTVEPTDHWHPGDRAYCLRGLKMGGRHIVETGRIYTVSAVRHLSGMMSDGLTLAGVEGALWFWSSRFVCLRGDPPFTAEMAMRTRRGWCDAYRTCADARSAKGENSRSEVEGEACQPGPKDAPDA